MQTFLPFEDFKETASSLDYRRLGKQRVETWQLLRAINGETKGWVNHPAAVMWRGHTGLLAVYGMTMCEEWIARGYNDTMLERFVKYTNELQLEDNFSKPYWLGTPELHISHQSNLIRKDPDFYGPKFPGIPDDLPYIWPEQLVSSNV